MFFYVAFSIQETSNDFVDHKNIEMLSIPSTSQGISNSSEISILTESVFDENEDDEEEGDSFNAQKLFSFAWQIAKGMVGNAITTQKIDKLRYSSEAGISTFSLEKGSLNEPFESLIRSPVLILPFVACLKHKIRPALSRWVLA